MGKFHLPVYGLKEEIDKKNLTGFFHPSPRAGSGAQKPDGHRLGTSFLSYFLKCSKSTPVTLQFRSACHNVAGPMPADLNTSPHAKSNHEDY
jgi:hypothetical protein